MKRSLSSLTITLLMSEFDISILFFFHQFFFPPPFYSSPYLFFITLHREHRWKLWMLLWRESTKIIWIVSWNTSTLYVFYFIFLSLFLFIHSLPSPLSILSQTGKSVTYEENFVQVMKKCQDKIKGTSWDSYTCNNQITIFFLHSSVFLCPNHSFIDQYVVYHPYYWLSPWGNARLY